MSVFSLMTSFTRSLSTSFTREQAKMNPVGGRFGLESERRGPGEIEVRDTRQQRQGRDEGVVRGIRNQPTDRISLVGAVSVERANGGGGGEEPASACDA